MVEDRGVAGQREAAGRGGREDELLALAPGDGIAPLAEQRDLGGRHSVEARSDSARVEPAAGLQVHVAGAVRRQRQHAVDTGIDLGERHGLVHTRLAVIGHHDDGVPLEESVDPASCLGQRADRGVAPLQRRERRVGAVLVGGVVVVGEVEDEEVERVAGHEPAADRRRVRVDRARRAVAPRERCAGAVGAEEVVEEEPLRPADVAEERQRGAVARAPTVGGEVDRCGAEAGVGERLEQGQRPAPRGAARSC